MRFQVLLMSPRTEKRIYKDSLKEAKDLAKRAKEKYKNRPEVQVYLISCQKAIAPREGWVRSTRKHLWCPYCAAERRFKPNTTWGTHQCPICKITTADYWVKTYNGLWDKPKEKKIRRSSR